MTRYQVVDNEITTMEDGTVRESAMFADIWRNRRAFAAVEISTINAQATDIRVEITKPMALEDVKQILAWNLDIDHNGDRHFSGDELTPLAQDLLSKLETGREALRLYGLYNS